MSKTKIEWCDHTINPIVGCRKISPGCKNCYAETMARRLAKMPKTAERYAAVCDEGGWTGETSLDLSCFNDLPRRPSAIFVCSMGDLFLAPAAQVHEVVQRMRNHPQHRFLLLTKRPREAKAYFCSIREDHRHQHHNIWLGVSVSNQEEADEKIPILLDTPVKHRFISVEPMLGPIGLLKLDCLRMTRDQDGDYLDWVICGAETGPRARQFDPDWAEALRDQCLEASTPTPFFFKKNSPGRPTPKDLAVRQFPWEVSA
jgi:protein gp37